MQGLRVGLVLHVCCRCSVFDGILCGCRPDLRDSVLRDRLTDLRSSLRPKDRVCGFMAG